jgi:transposase-like protein
MRKQELARGAARRLAITRHAQEVTGNVAGTCRYYGITRQAYYAWLRRYEEGGVSRTSPRIATFSPDTASRLVRPPRLPRLNAVRLAPNVFPQVVRPGGLEPPAF